MKRTGAAMKRTFTVTINVPTPHDRAYSWLSRFGDRFLPTLEDQLVAVLDEQIDALENDLRDTLDADAAITVAMVEEVPQ